MALPIYLQDRILMCLLREGEIEKRSLLSPRVHFDSIAGINPALKDMEKAGLIRSLRKRDQPGNPAVISLTIKGNKYFKDNFLETYEVIKSDD